MAEYPDYFTDEVEMFVHEACVRDTAAETDMAALVDAWRQWCALTGRPNWSSTVLGLGLRALGFTKRKSRGRILRRGLRLRSDWRADIAGTVSDNRPQPSPQPT